jgi:hypothetical protein
MLWFEPMPWGRWALVLLVAAGAAYVEFRPDPSVEQPFATMAIAPGETIGPDNVELRRVPVGLLESAELGDVVSRPVEAGEPVLATDVNDSESPIPPGWWVVGVELPDGASAGDGVRLVLLDTGEEVEGIVAHPGSDDPFAAADGGVAVSSNESAAVALAAANGRLAVLVSTG